MTSSRTVAPRPAHGGRTWQPNPLPWIQPKPATVGPRDPFERDADRMADAVAGGAVARPEHNSGQRAAGTTSLESPVRSLGGGRPLDGSLRTYFEPRFGHDFGQVRVHAGPEAADAARLAGARAFTAGPHIVFGAGEYAPRSAQGQSLLAHELTHTVQQASAVRTPPIQRQEQEEPATIGANDILPFAEDSQIQIDQILDETFFNLLRGFQPETATTIEVVSGQRATVTSATADLVEARLNQNELTVPQGTYRDVRVRLVRAASGTFDFEITGETGTPPARTAIFAERDLTATRSGGAVVLSSGGGAGAVPRLRVSGTAEGGVNLAVLKESFIDQIPEVARGLVPDRIDVLRLSALPPASAGTAAVERAAREASERAAAQRTTPRQQVSLGAGVLSGEQTRFLLEGSWEYHFQPVTSVGGLFQVPLRVAIQYAPTSEVLGRVSTGAGVSLSALDIPVNVRLLVGAAGGQVLGPEVLGERPLVPAAGITVGGGVGLEIARWRINLDYEHLFNLIPDTEVGGIHTAILSGGLAF